MKCTTNSTTSAHKVVLTTGAPLSSLGVSYTHTARQHTGNSLEARNGKRRILTPLLVTFTRWQCWVTTPSSGRKRKLFIVSYLSARWQIRPVVILLERNESTILLYYIIELFFTICWNLHREIYGISRCVKSVRVTDSERFCFWIRRCQLLSLSITQLISCWEQSWDMEKDRLINKVCQGLLSFVPLS